MSESTKTIIKYFCDRFLELDYYPDNIKTVLDLSLEKLKGIAKEELVFLNKNNIETIRDFSSIDISTYDNFIEKQEISEKTLKKICEFIEEDFNRYILNWLKYTKLKRHSAWDHEVMKIHAKSIGKWKRL